MQFKCERLKKIRESLGINKAEAARRLNMSAMGYGRYENGQREPSFQTVSFIAQVFGTSSDYLYGITDKEKTESITLTSDDNPKFYELVNLCVNNKDLCDRLIAYSIRFKNPYEDKKEQMNMDPAERKKLVETRIKWTLLAEEDHKRRMNGIKRREEEYKKLKVENENLAKVRATLIDEINEKKKLIAEKNALIEKLQKELETKK